MESHVPPSPDKPAEELKELLRHAQRVYDSDKALWVFADSSGVMAITVGFMATIGLGSMKPILYTVSFLLLLWASSRRLNAYKIRQKPTIARLIKLIADTQAADMLGPILDLNLTENLRSDYPEIEATVNAAVLRLLPLITASDAGSLNTQQHKRLHYYRYQDGSWSGDGRDLDKLPYARGLIHALEQIGDKRDLPQIQVWLQNERCKAELTASLQRCFDIVSERVAREEGKDFLLRPDSKPETGETLLRAAAECADRPTEQLLRAASDDAVPPS
jgi:hypothetical protein